MFKAHIYVRADVKSSALYSGNNDKPYDVIVVTFPLFSLLIIYIFNLIFYFQVIERKRILDKQNSKTYFHRSFF